MKQTPIHEIHNEEVLKLIPETSKKIIEIGCSSGVLAREFKKTTLMPTGLALKLIQITHN